MADKTRKISDEQKKAWVQEIYVDKTITPTELAKRENVHITNLSRWRKQFSQNGKPKVKAKAVHTVNESSPAPQGLRVEIKTLKEKQRHLEERLTKLEELI
jgi:transposase-like protein